MSIANELYHNNIPLFSASSRFQVITNTPSPWRGEGGGEGDDKFFLSPSF
jgi:hypothetical protein